MKLEVRWFLDHVDEVVIAKWPSTDLVAVRGDLHGNYDESLLFKLYKKKGETCEKVSSLILDKSLVEVIDAWEVDTYASYWKWLTDRLGIPLAFDVEPTSVFDGEIQLDPEAIEIYHILCTNLPFVWPDSELIPWIEQQLEI